MGFNQLFLLCEKKKICARQTFKKIIDRYVKEKKIEIIREGKQGFQYFFNGPTLKADKEELEEIRFHFDFVKAAFEAIMQYEHKMEDYEKMAITTIAYQQLEGIIIRVTTLDVI